jgi:hypothetical protein
MIDGYNNLNFTCRGKNKYSVVIFDRYNNLNFTLMRKKISVRGYA